MHHGLHTLCQPAGSCQHFLPLPPYWPQGRSACPTSPSPHQLRRACTVFWREAPGCSAHQRRPLHRLLRDPSDLSTHRCHLSLQLASIPNRWGGKALTHASWSSVLVSRACSWARALLLVRLASWWWPCNEPGNIAVACFTMFLLIKLPQVLACTIFPMQEH